MGNLKPTLWARKTREYPLTKTTIIRPRIVDTPSALQWKPFFPSLPVFLGQRIRAPILQPYAHRTHLYSRTYSPAARTISYQLYFCDNIFYAAFVLIPSISSRAAGTFFPVAHASAHTQARFYAHPDTPSNGFPFDEISRGSQRGHIGMELQPNGLANYGGGSPRTLHDSSLPIRSTSFADIRSHTRPRFRTNWLLYAARGTGRAKREVKGRSVNTRKWTN